MATATKKSGTSASAARQTAKPGTKTKAPTKKPSASSTRAVNSASKPTASLNKPAASPKKASTSSSAASGKGLIPTGKANPMNPPATSRGTKAAMATQKTGTTARVGNPMKTATGKSASKVVASAASPAKVSAPSPAKKSIGESKSKRPSTLRKPEVDVLAAQAKAKQSRESAAKQKPEGKVEADDRTSRSAGRHSGASDAEYVTEKGDARRRDPDVNKNSQAQKDDTRDGQRDQDPHPKKRSDGAKIQDGGARQAQVSRSRPSQSTGPTRK